ncbi:toxin glutamine deamidase domain-containing protein, partial [Gordonia paraffinivorans]
MAAADSGTDASQSPEGLPAVDQHSDTAAPADKVGDTGDSDAPASEETVVPDSDHLSGLDLPDGDGTTPATTTDPTTSVDSTPTDASDADPAPEQADDPSSTPEDPSTPTNPDDVDTTDCGHNSLDALAERHPDLPSDRSGIGERGDGPVPAGALYDAAGITPDLHPRQGADQAGHPDDGATDAFDAISDRLTELGDGSTALVTSNWTAGAYTGGHTYLAHNDGGDITFTDPTSGESHPWPPTYSDVGDVAAGYVNSDGTPVHGNSTAGDVSSAIGEVDANKKPATYTDWETVDRSDLHPDFDAPRHAHPDGAISEQEVRTRTATLPTGETVTIEERRTVYAPGHPPGQD